MRAGVHARAQVQTHAHVEAHTHAHTHAQPDILVSVHSDLVSSLGAEAKSKAHLYML